MEEFLNNYVVDEMMCPLALLLRYKTTSKDDVIDYIISKDIYTTIYDIGLLDEIRKSMINPLIRDENYNKVEKILLATARLYVEAVKTNMANDDATFMERVTSLDYNSINRESQDVIIDKLNSNSVIKEYLPQVLSGANFTLDKFLEENILEFMDQNDVKNIINEFSILRIVMSNVYYLVDNKEQLELRLKEKEDNIKSILINSTNKTNTLNLTNDLCTDFKLVYEKVKYLDLVLQNLASEIKDIKKTDLFDINDLYINTIGRMDSNNLTADDMYIFETGQSIKIKEQKVYNSIIDTLNDNVSKFNTINSMFTALLIKLDL